MSYLIVSHNDGAMRTTEVLAERASKKDAEKVLIKDVAKTILDAKRTLDEVNFDEDGADIEICGVTYEWEIIPR